MSETDTKRPLPPPLEFRTPDCSICGEETVFEEGFYCENCQAAWDEHGAPEGEWYEDPKREAEQCPSIHRPYPDNANERLAAIEYHCVLELGHADRDVPLHQAPDSWGGWKDSEASK